MQHQFVRYAAISGLTWAIDFACFIALYWAIGIPSALLVARIAAGIFAFLAHKLGSFGSRTPVRLHEVAGYVGLVAINYLLSLGLISLMPTQTMLLASAAKLASEVLIFTLNFFVLRRLFRIAAA